MLVDLDDAESLCVPMLAREAAVCVCMLCGYQLEEMDGQNEREILLIKKQKQRAGRLSDSAAPLNSGNRSDINSVLVVVFLYVVNFPSKLPVASFEYCAMLINLSLVFIVCVRLTGQVNFCLSSHPRLCSGGGSHEDKCL